MVQTILFNVIVNHVKVLVFLMFNHKVAMHFLHE